MGHLMLFLCVIPIVSSITISPNGNSPEIKMRRGMMVDVKKPTSPIVIDSETSAQKLVEKTMNLNTNSKLSINERYRRLIPYMTFYYANNLAQQALKPEPAHNIVEVEKANIVEARQAKKILLAHRNIPRYQGNRLTHYNIASANPPKLYYKDITNHHSIKFPNYNGAAHQLNAQYEYERFIQKPHREHIAPLSPPVKKPYININEHEGHAQHYYLADKPTKYRLIPYEQTPPVSVVSENDQFQRVKNPEPVPVLLSEDSFVRSRHPLTHYSLNRPFNVPNPSPARKLPAVVSESYYDNRHPQMAEPIIEGGFKPIIHHVSQTTVAPFFTSTLETSSPETEKPRPIHVLETSVPEIDDERYYDYSANKPQISAQFASNKLNLGGLINSLQTSHSIPKTITRENVGASIRTLLHVLNSLKAEQNEVETPILSTPTPFVVADVVTPRRVISTSPSTVADDLHEEPYLANVNLPSQHLDFPTGGGTSQRFPQLQSSDDEGGTPGIPGVDYPILTTIPKTKFDCKTQRYKGFFADPETRCQVWHYCDLNGGQASFLCPNGTIFSQAGLTCDWWFNVRCDSTTQLYVLNESLYKYILPHSPKFPEDYSGPLVDKYLTLKFKEMEEQFKKNKNKLKASEKIDSQSSEESTGPANEDVSTEDNTERTETISESSVIVESPGTSGNVQRLQED